MKRFLGILLIICFAFSIAPLYASPDDDIKALTEKQNKNKKNQQSVQNTIEQKNKEMKKLEGQLVDLDKNLNKTESQLEAVEIELAKLDNKIAITIRELERASESAEEQKALLKKRVRVMYENGSVGYLSVLLDSTSFSDFLVRLDFLRKIIQHDNKLLKEANEYRNNIEETKVQLQAEQEQKEKLKKDIGNKKEQMEKLKTDKKKTIDSIENNLEQLEKQLDKLMKESEEFAKLIVAAQSKNKYADGDMSWPAPGYFRVTSEYGYRIHPVLKVKKMHTGIDVGVPSGNNIVAANDGKVIYSDYYGGYGYAVIIDHGGKISTLYAHNSKLLVSVGDQVKKGQTIAKSGSTGLSTGPHLHFEVRENGQHVDPMKYFKSK